jgi:hypothetical protein
VVFAKKLFHRREVDPRAYVFVWVGMRLEKKEAFTTTESLELSPRMVCPAIERFPVVVTFPCREIVKISLLPLFAFNT